MAPAGKRGICVPWDFAEEDWPLYQGAIDAGKISWVSNWEMWKPKGLPNNVTYVPTCRTGNEANQIGDYFKGYATDHQVADFLGFNEPDIPSQANMTVDQAVQLWKQHVLPMKAAMRGSDCKKGKVRIGSPGVSNAPQGIPFLRDFFRKLGGVDAAGVNHVSIHYYSPDVEHFKRYVTEAYEAFKRPVWVTEFACTNWNPGAPVPEEAVLHFIKEALEFLDEAPFVERYSWFGAMRDVGEAVGRSNGLQVGGKLSSAGELYLSL